MAYVLSDQAIECLQNDPVLAGRVAVLLGVNTTSMATLITRKAKALNTWHTVELIAKAMDVTGWEILVKETE